MSYRKLNKIVNLQESIQKLEEVEQKRFEEVQKLRQTDFQEKQKFEDELDTAFYFSVVFNTRTERDEWLKKHGVELVEDFFVKAENFNI